MSRPRDTDKNIDGKTPTETTPPRLPKPPTTGKRHTPATPPTSPKPPRLPASPSARPGRRGDAPSDIQVTSRLERITVEPTPAPLPPSPAAADADRWFEQVPTNPGAPSSNPPRAPTHKNPVAHAHHAAHHRSAPAWLFPVLLAVTSLTVGMVLGALLFGRGSTHCPVSPAPTTAPSH